MNTKRQTVWLVSMLSLMVILSAYYLFTEDVNPSSDMLTDSTQQEQVTTDATEASGNTTLQNGISVTEVTKSADADTGSGSDAAKDTGTTPAGTEVTDKGDKTAADTATGESAKPGAASGDTAAANKTDEEVLKQLEASGGASSTLFNQLQQERDQKYYEEYNRLYSSISDTKQNPDKANDAVQQLDQLEDKNTKITGLEDELVKQFSNAFVSEDNDKYKVVVQSDKLEKSQADSIMMMVIKELGVTGDQVSVQFVPSNS
ncbi:SpoIIIAH-like family protein [Paenibacillus sp. sptzw28]|uniref:SpoIIIAH-like family protein n=1 Tax=Paenibacillus sp. sptzw28 TaxID=715179 RepID=UPI001C6E9BBC|nr:SpoIIIAH-like family protein [Paenibacillus sp. sptzw28]QYR20005.1 SpoIIIAH-like family protein [Paenibacillus sp. sptzw28]